MTKPVALADGTYDRLKRRRRPGESFSNTIDRLMQEPKKDPTYFAQNVPRSKIPAARRLQEIEADRDASLEDA